MRCARSAVALALLLVVAAVHGYPVVANPPQWSWSSLGGMSFAHTGQAQPYSDDDLKLLAKYRMVQFDKKQGIATMPNLSTEDRLIAAAKQVKQYNPKAQVLMYINGLINFEAQRLYNVTNDSLLLKNSQGQKVHLKGNTVFDMQQPAMRQLFVDDALYGMSSGFFNGVFIDRANWCEKCADRTGWDNETCASMVPFQRQLFVELTSALGEGNITLAKETSQAPAIDWQVANAAMTSDTFCSAYWYVIQLHSASFLPIL